jgi:hypothetical protein
MLVLGGGLAGLIVGMYERRAVVVTDKIGFGVAGSDPLILLHKSPETERFLRDLGLGYNVVTKPIGYKWRGDVLEFKDLPSEAHDSLLLKKMVPAAALLASRAAGIDVVVHTPSRAIAGDSESEGSSYISYADVDSKDVARRLVEKVADRVTFGRVTAIYNAYVDIDFADGRKEAVSADKIVSTLPAPVFARLWAGFPAWRPPLSYAPLTFWIEAGAPPWWSDKWCVVYDCDEDSPACRISSSSGRTQYEVTGNYEAPAGCLATFAYPFGRIYQAGGGLDAPGNIVFVGRFAEWKYSVLVDDVLRRVWWGGVLDA